MRTITLDIEEWQRVLGVLAQGQWATVNPLIMKIGEQLRLQEPAPPAPAKGNGAAVEAAPEA
jgi:hypothetical protein